MSIRSLCIPKIQIFCLSPAQKPARHLAQAPHRRRAHRAQPRRRQDLGYSDRRIAGTYPRQHRRHGDGRLERRLCYFAGTTDGDVFYSDDEGENWKTIISGIGPVSKSHHHINLSLDEQAAHH